MIIENSFNHGATVSLASTCRIALTRSGVRVANTWIRHFANRRGPRSGRREVFREIVERIEGIPAHRNDDLRVHIECSVEDSSFRWKLWLADHRYRRRNPSIRSRISRKTLVTTPRTSSISKMSGSMCIATGRPLRVKTICQVEPMKPSAPVIKIVSIYHSRESKG